jgi:predicted nucleic acid-binding protein
VIVANSTPLIELAKIGRFDLLRQVYGRLAIPQEVWDEVVVQGAGQAGAAEVQNADWIDVLAVSNPTSVAALQATYPHIGAGEAAAIILAKEQSASLVDG